MILDSEDQRLKIIQLLELAVPVASHGNPLNALEFSQWNNSLFTPIYKEVKEASIAEQRSLSVNIN